MAAKGAAFGIRHLLKKVDENFAWAKPRGRVRRRECQRGLPRYFFSAIALFACSAIFAAVRP